MIAEFLRCRCGRTFVKAAHLKRHEPTCPGRCSGCNAVPPRHVPGCELKPARRRPSSPPPAPVDPRQRKLPGVE